jgi:hypothetical protein
MNFIRLYSGSEDGMTIGKVIIYKSYANIRKSHSTVIDK